MKGNWQSIHRFSHFLSKTVKKFAVFSFLNVFFVSYVVDWRYCSLPPLRLHSPVQCCLIKMPQGSTVKRLNAKRKRPAGGAGGELDRSTLNKSLLKTTWLTKQKNPITDLIESTHPGDGADVVGDGDQRCSGQVLFGHRLPLLFGHHVAETTRAKHKPR